MNREGGMVDRTDGKGYAEKQLLRDCFKVGTITMQN